GEGGGYGEGMDGQGLAGAGETGGGHRGPPPQSARADCCLPRLFAQAVSRVDGGTALVGRGRVGELIGRQKKKEEWCSHDRTTEVQFFSPPLRTRCGEE